MNITRINLKGRDFLTLKDFSGEEILYLIEKAAELKEKKKKGIYEKHLENKNIALIFEKPSTRTRCAFTVAANDEGAHPEYLGKNDIQLGHKESVEDTARVLGSMFDGIEFRGFSQKVVETLAEYAPVPVWNGLTDEDHPTQILADLLTIKEQFGTVKGVNFVYIGDGRNNMANALLIGASKVGMNCTICAPKELQPENELLRLCEDYAAESGSKIFVSEDINCVKDAAVIYTDVWCSMGEEEKASERIELLKNYQVNKELMAMTERADTVFMHCLPAVKGNEVTKEVFEQYAEIVFRQAENRMHTIKSVMVATIKGEF